MASPRKQHCANCIGTLSIPIAVEEKRSVVSVRPFDTRLSFLQVQRSHDNDRSNVDVMGQGRTKVGAEMCVLHIVSAAAFWA